jgi:hypothetical protein
LPAEAFVEADGRGVLGHHVEDESAAVLVGVVPGGADKPLAQGVAARLMQDEQAAEDRDGVGALLLISESPRPVGAASKGTKRFLHSGAGFGRSPAAGGACSVRDGPDSRTCRWDRAHCLP